MTEARATRIQRAGRDEPIRRLAPGLMLEGGGADFWSAAEAGRMGLWTLDLTTGELAVSDQFKRNLGQDPASPLTWAELDQLVHPDDRRMRRTALDRTLQTGADYEFRYRVRLAGEELRWIHVRARLTRDEAGLAVRLAGVSFDVTEARAAERRLERSEEALRLAADAAEVGTWDLDPLADVLTWSDRTKAMFGISPQAPCSMEDFYAGLHPEDREATSAAFASALDPQLRAVYDVEYRTVGKEDGIVRWIAARGRGLFEDGRCRRVIGTVIDITARKQVEVRQAFLLGLADRLRRLTGSDKITDAALRALGHHLGAQRVGYSRILDDDATVQLHTSYADGVEPLNGAHVLDSFGQEVMARQRRGETIVADDLTLDPVHDPQAWRAIDTRAFVSVPLIRDGRLRRTVFVNFRTPHAWTPGEVSLIEDVASRAWDAMERARAEAALRALNASLEEQVEARVREADRTWRLSPVVMATAAADGLMLDVNPAWTAVLGWSAQETIGRNVMEFVAPEDREAGAAGMQALARGEAVLDVQSSFVTKSGGRRCIAWTSVPQDGRIYGYGRDVSDQLAAEERLRQSQKMDAVGQLTGGLAHDFNNMLAAVSGSLELMAIRLGQGRPEDVPRLLEGAQSAVDRAASLTRRLLAFSRQQTLDPRPVNVDALVAGMEELIRRTVGQLLDVRIEAAPDLWPTLADPHQLENALLNLCINARDAMPDGGRLTVRTLNATLDEAAAREADLPPGGYVRLLVSDTGRGMSAEVRRRAFDPFFTTKPAGSGTGLGLSMIYGFARQSGGRATIQSEEGRGTTVAICLPRHVEPPPA